MVEMTQDDFEEFKTALGKDILGMAIDNISLRRHVRELESRVESLTNQLVEAQMIQHQSPKE